MIEQGSPEWFESRLGKCTASRCADVMAMTKSGPGAARKNYLAELLCQRLTGTMEEGFTSAAMQRGTELEPMARGRYEFENDLLVNEVGLIDHPTIANFAASPDGLVGDDGMLEIKCPNTATHIDFLRTGNIDGKYRWQMTAQMMCARRKWVDFVSYDDRLPAPLDYKCVRYALDEKKAAELMAGVIEFLSELDGTEAELKAMAETLKEAA